MGFPKMSPRAAAAMLVVGVELAGCSTDDSSKGGSHDVGATSSRDAAGSGRQPTFPQSTGPCPEFREGLATFTVNGTERSVMLYVDEAASSTADGPLLVYWHGTFGEPAQAIDAFGPAGIERIKGAGGVVAAPVPANDSGYPWVSGDLESDYALMDEIVACADAKIGIDTRHIHSSGFSAGGLFTSLLGFARANYIASVATYSGGNAVGPSAAPENRFASMILFGGDADEYVLNFRDASRVYYDALVGAGHFVFLCNHGRGHAIPEDAPASVVQFFLDHPYMQDSPYAGGLPESFPSYCSLDAGWDASAPHSADGGACNDLVNQADKITATQVADPMPVGEGGEFVDGTYFATKFEIYPGSLVPLGNITHEMAVVSGGISQNVLGEQHVTLRIETSGNSIQLMALCGVLVTQFSSYTATPTSFTLFHEQARFVETYTKQ